MLKKDYLVLAKEWDYEKNANNGIFFEDVSDGSNKIAWWKCKNNHSYQRCIYERTTKHYGCPYCSGRRILPGFNDFATKYPKLLAEWDYKKNKELGIDPTKIGIGFGPKVWWICPKGHSYDSVIHPRTTGCGCPYCSNKRILKGFNDLATINPELAADWDYDKNTIKPTEISYGSTKKVWWKCKKGHSYQTSVSSRARLKVGCPYCSRQKAIPGISDLFSNYPSLKDEWNFEKNKIDPTTIVRGGSRKFWWKCKKGHEWQSNVANRIRHDGSINQCPTCAKRNRISFPEKIIFYYIGKAFDDAVENYKSKWLGKKELDIYIPSAKVGIEYDGEYYHNVNKDIAKDKLCYENGVKLIRIREKKAEKLESSSIVYQIAENGRADGKHLIGALRFLEKELDVDMDIDLDRDHDVLRRQVENYEIENCIAKTHPEILAEWDYAKNKELGLTPENVSRGTSGHIWWVCNRGHSYKSTLPNRINGRTGCPYCSIPPKKILAGFNDLATTNPELARRWDFEKNNVKPTEITRFSNKTIWLICDNGHSYSMPLNNIQNADGCPYCSGHRLLVGFNDLATTHPHLLKEWDYKKNTIKPTEVGKGQMRKVWWKCSRKHSYQASIANRANHKSGCPYCSGKKVLEGFNDLATTHPSLLKEWDYDKNKIKPTEISKGSDRKIWLKCKKGHSYETTILSRLSGCKCGYCSGRKTLKGFNDLATTNPKLAREWNFEKNGNLKPYDVTTKSGKKVWWKCNKGHEWEAIIADRSEGRGCPYCSNRKVMKGFNDLATTRRDLLLWWDYEKNKTIKPTEVTAGSGKKVWWKCNKGHEWETAIDHISKGTRCPYCAGKKRIQNE